jgi:cytochrome c oxidase subunit II
MQGPRLRSGRGPRLRSGQALAAAAGALLFSGCSGNQSMFNPQGPIARSMADLGWFLVWLCAAIYIAVMVALAIALFRRRRESDSLPETRARLVRNVVLASAATVVTLVALAVVTFASDRGLNSPSGPGAITVDVIGHQWWWDFQYRDISPNDFVTSPNELHVPVGVPVVIKAMSRDVIHSFWTPNLHGKRDLIPGVVTNTWFQADAPGVYRGQCAEFCGHQHAHMAYQVVAEPTDKFLEWIQHQRQPAMEPSTGEARRGRDVFMRSACVTCHTIRGTDAGSRVGPELTHVGSRLTIAAGTLPNTRDHLSGWVVNSQKTKPGNRMPPIGLTNDDLQAVLSYLRSLR